MITRTIDTKKYTLERLSYEILGEAESLYLQFKIEEDIPFGVRTYSYGLNFSADEMALVMEMLEQNFADYVVNKLVENEA
jgi:hypothetical protein